MIPEEAITKITNCIVSEFPCFGRGNAIKDNPISVAMKEHKPMFAAGVLVEEVVRFVVRELSLE